MKIYSFWSADTTYFTKSKSLNKAQEVGKENMKCYIECCEELGDEQNLTIDQFIPTEVEPITVAWFNQSIKTDSDTMILDDELYTFLKGGE